MNSWIQKKGYIEKGSWRITGARVNGEIIYSLHKKIHGKYEIQEAGSLEEMKAKTVRENPYIDGIRGALSKAETKKSDNYKPGSRNEGLFLNKKEPA